MHTYLFITDPNVNDPEAVRSGDWGEWSCSSTTETDDLALVYLTGTGIKYEWRATSKARSEKNEDFPYGCDVQYVRTFRPPITIQELRSEFSRDEWPAPYTNFRGMRSIRLKEGVASRIRDLRRKRRKEGAKFNKAKTPEAADISEPPNKVQFTTYRILRDTALAREIKKQHRFKCQVCHGNALKISKGSLYSEAHHIKPLGSPHGGLDISGNIICVCPNCHVLLDFGAIQLDISRLGTNPNHRVEQEYIDYHNLHIFQKKAI